MKYTPYSHSKVQRGNCPFSFRRKYIDKEKGVPGPNSEFGKVVHNIIADVIKAQVHEDMYVLPELIRDRTSLAVADRIDEIQEIMETFRHRFYIEREHVVGIEEAISINADGSEAPWETAWLRGVLDLIEIDGTHATITDHKTQYNIFNQAEMDKNRQLTMYCYLAKAMYPQIEKFTVKIYFARYGIYRRSERTLQDIERFDQQIRIKIAKIEGIEEWVPVAGAGCTYCEYLKECPLALFDMKGTEVPVVSTREQAHEISRLIRVREEQLKRDKALLQEFCAHYGAVAASSDYAYGYRESKVSEWPIQATKEVLERHGQRLEDHVTVSRRSVDKLASAAQRLDPDLADELESVKVTKTETRFSGYKLP